MNYNFDLDLPVGQVGERLLSQSLLGGKKIEVKRDFLVGKTGNIVVEFESRGKPSGISTTQADWWAFVLSGQVFNDEVIIMIQTKRLKNLISQSNFPITKGGDNKSSFMYIISLKYLYE